MTLAKQNEKSNLIG